MTTPLITRLEEAAEEAAEGSRELDELVALGTTHPYGIGPSGRAALLPYTTSLDAALALAERVLPEMNCTGFDKTPLGVEAYVSLNNVDSGHWCEVGWHKSSPALALCIAILKATTPNAGERG